jgi:hypothetical protein
MEGNNPIICVFGRIGDIPYTPRLAIESSSFGVPIFPLLLFGSFGFIVHSISKGKKCTYD